MTELVDPHRYAAALETTRYLRAAIAELPESLREVATGILVEKRTFSDVSQDLGIRQGELVSRLHRAQLAIGMSLMSGGRPAH